MTPKILKLLREALEEARKEKAGAGRGDRGRHLALCVTHLEDAWLRAALGYRLNGLSLPGEAE